MFPSATAVQITSLPPRYAEHLPCLCISICYALGAMKFLLSFSRAPQHLVLGVSLIQRADREFVVLDGTWRQAREMLAATPFLASLTHVCLPHTQVRCHFAICKLFCVVKSVSTSYFADQRVSCPHAACRWSIVHTRGNRPYHRGCLSRTHSATDCGTAIRAVHRHMRRQYSFTTKPCALRRSPSFTCHRRCRADSAARLSKV